MANYGHVNAVRILAGQPTDMESCKEHQAQWLTGPRPCLVSLVLLPGYLKAWLEKPGNLGMARSFQGIPKRNGMEAMKAWGFLDKEAELVSR